MVIKKDKSEISVTLPNRKNLKIIITGDAATGKTTTAKILSEKFNIPVFHTDIFLADKNMNLNSSTYIKEQVEKIIENNPSYIIDGTMLGGDMEFFDKLINQANLIINFDFPMRFVVDSWFKRAEDVEAGKHRPQGMPDMVESYLNPKAMKVFFTSSASFIDEKKKREEHYKKAAHKVHTIRSHEEIDKFLERLNNDSLINAKKKRLALPKGIQKGKSGLA